MPNVVEVIVENSENVEVFGATTEIVEVIVPGPAGPEPTVPAAIVYTFDAGENVITTGNKGAIAVPFACTIQSWTLTASPSGSLTVDVFKTSYAGFPSYSGTSITGGDKPTISNGQKATSSSLTAWTTSISAGDVLAFSVDAATNVTIATLTLKVIRS